MVKIGNLTEVSVTEMAASDTVFQEFLEINAHARTVDTRRSFFPPPSPRLGTRLALPPLAQTNVASYALYSLPCITTSMEIWLSPSLHKVSFTLP